MSIVILGSFNPSILQPAWCASHNLIKEEEAEHAEADTFHGEFSRFSLEWLKVQVLRDRFEASTTTESPSFQPLRDFVVGAFTILEHTPVRMLGLNSERHYQMESEEAWHGIGIRLAPPGPWESSLEQPRMLSLTMQGQRTDDMTGMVRAKVEPSQSITFGVYVNVNDHFDIRTEDGEAVPANVAVQTILDHWAAFWERPDAIAKALFEVLE